MCGNLNLAPVCNMKIVLIKEYKLVRQYAINGMLLYLSIKQLKPQCLFLHLVNLP